MRGRLTITPVTNEELPALRWENLIGWVAAMSILIWAVWWGPKGGFSVWWPIGLTILAVPLGWLLGYKLLIGPLFCGFVIRHKP